MHGFVMCFFHKSLVTLLNLPYSFRRWYSFHYAVVVMFLTIPVSTDVCGISRFLLLEQGHNEHERHLSLCPFAVYFSRKHRRSGISRWVIGYVH